MKRLIRAVFALVALPFALAGCLPDKFATPAEEARAQRWLGELKARHFDAIGAAMDPSVHVDDLPATLAKMAGIFPATPPTSTTLVGDSHLSSPEGTVVNLTYEFDFGGQWVLANVAIKSRDGVETIAGISAYRLTQSLEQHNRFGLADKPPVCYLVLALAVLMPALTIFALVVCARTKLRGRKWPWIAFILFGFGQVLVNWTTGQWDFHVVVITLLSASATAMPYGPWVLTASVPVGALVFLAQRLSLQAPPPIPLAGPAAAVE